MVRVWVKASVGARVRVWLGLVRGYIRVQFGFRVTIRVSVGLVLGLLL